MSVRQEREKEVTQKPAVELLKKAGYIELSKNDIREAREKRTNTALLTTILRKQLKKINDIEYGNKVEKFSDATIERAIRDLDVPVNEGLQKASDDVYQLIVHGKSYKETVKSDTGFKIDRTFNLKFIDWNPETFLKNNIFHVAKEFVVLSEKNKEVRVDIALFVNGIPLAVIECKPPEESANDAITQMIRNQNEEEESYAPQLFKFTTFLVGTNKNEIKYGTTKTDFVHYSNWRYEDDEKEEVENKVNSFDLEGKRSPQDYVLYSLLRPERLLVFTKYFVIFDAHIKKIAKHQQYFGVVNLIKRINEWDEDGNRKGGVIWHTQGSGKSILMVMAANYLLHNIENSRIVLVTDRKALDKQIEKTFSNTKKNPAKAMSGRDLVEKIRNKKNHVITTVINKFNTADGYDVVDKSRDIFVFVDEAHRTQYDEFATKMRTVFPNAPYIGFTGTPLLKNDKTRRKFGDYIHKYTISDGLRDDVTVPLYYEGKFVDQKVDKQNIDLWYEATCKNLNDRQKARLSNTYSRLENILSSNHRIKRIALDILHLYNENIKGTGFNAMLATNSRLEAVRYYNTFKELDDHLEVAVCISAPEKRESEDDLRANNSGEVLKFWNDMMNKFGDEDTYDENIRTKFQDGEIDILIVCSKLLTGFDAPRCQVMYIDKQLKEHTLLQAIARVNRVYEGKDYGLIVDYRGLLDETTEAMNMYSGDGDLDSFDQQDLVGLMDNVLENIPKLREAFKEIESNFANLKNKDDFQEVEDFLYENENIRKKFEEDYSKFGKLLASILESEVAYRELKNSDPQFIPLCKEKFKFYDSILKAIKFRTNETIDEKLYSNKIRNLLDEHLLVKEVYDITKPINLMECGALDFDNMPVKSDRSKADAIAASMSTYIETKRYDNPLMYDSFSARIEEVLARYKEKRERDASKFDADYLQEILEIMEDVRNQNIKIEYPESITEDSKAQKYYGAIKKTLKEFIESDDVIAQIAIEIKEIFKENTKVDWHENTDIHNEIKQAIDDLFYDYEVEQGIKVSGETIDEISCECIKIAKAKADY